MNTNVARIEKESNSLPVLNSPKLVMTLLVRDEADILSDNINFHLAQGIDHFIITDNLSKDETPEIIKNYVASGCATYIYEPEDNYNQSQWVTRMAHMAYEKFQADWVINADADEFWLAKKGSIKGYLAGLPDKIEAVSVPRHDFPCIHDQEGLWHQKMTYQKQLSLDYCGEPLQAKAAHRGSLDVTIAQGNHSVRGIKNKAMPSDCLEILHFPMRSKVQYETKIRNGGAAYKRNTLLGPYAGRAWRELYEIYQQQGSLEAYYLSQSIASSEITLAIKAGLLKENMQLADFFKPEMSL